MASKNTCLICLGDCLNPKLLTCYHTFCEACIDDYIKVHARLGKFNCPNCQQEIEVSEAGSNQFAADDNGNIKQFCTKHKNEEIEVYCYNCCVTCCSVCATVDHENHKKGLSDKVNMEMRNTILKLKTESEKKIKQLQEHSDYLRIKISDINNSCNKACNNVDIRISTICEMAGNMGEGIKVEINKLANEEKCKISKLVDDVEKMASKLKEWCEYSDRILQSKSIIKVLDKTGLADVRKKIHHDISTNLQTPTVSQADYPMVKINVDILKQLFGEIQSTTTFSCSFNMNDLMNADKHHTSDVVIQGMTWCVSAVHLADIFLSGIAIYMKLRNVHFKPIKSVTTDFKLKLLNIQEDRKSIVRQSTYTFNPGDGGMVSIDL